MAVSSLVSLAAVGMDQGSHSGEETASVRVVAAADLAAAASVGRRPLMLATLRERLVPPLNRDGRLVIAASAVRALDYGFVSIFLGVYLSILDFSALQAGLVFGSIMAGGALSNVVCTWRGDAIGRRRMLVTMSGLMVLGGALLPFASSVLALGLIGLIAMTTSTGGDRTAFLSLDTAILAGASDAAHRTMLFSWYNIVGVGAKAVGALLIALPPLIDAWTGLDELGSAKAMFGVYVAIAAAGIFLYGRLSADVEIERQTIPTTSSLSRQSRSRMTRLAALFSMDAFGGGFMVRSYMSFWLVSKFGLDLGSIAAVFFAGQLLNAVSVMLAAPVAGRIGLINTMAWTQALSNTFMIGVAFAGNVWVAIALLLARELSNDMDIPTRQSYTMAIVPPEARTATAAFTNLGRNVTQTVSPVLAGLVAQLTFLGAPFIIGGGVKLVYNTALYLMFRGSRRWKNPSCSALRLPGQPRQSRSSLLRSQGQRLQLRQESIGSPCGDGRARCLPEHMPAYEPEGVHNRY